MLQGRRAANKHLHTKDADMTVSWVLPDGEELEMASLLLLCFGNIPQMLSSVVSLNTL